MASSQSEHIAELKKVMRRDAPVYVEFEKRCERAQNYFNSVYLAIHAFTPECIWRQNEENLFESIKGWCEYIDLGDFERERDPHADPISLLKKLKKSDFYQYFSVDYPLLTFLYESGHTNLYHFARDHKNDLFPLDPPDKVFHLNEIRRFFEMNGPGSTVLNDTFFNMPMIKPKGRMDVYNPGKILVEIDLNEPKEANRDLIYKLHEEYHRDPEQLQSLDQLCDLPLPPKESIHPAIEDHAMYIDPSEKHLFGRLADILFIYDCYKVGLSHETKQQPYVMDQIDLYWNNTKDLPKKTEMHKKTYKDYLKLGLELIDQRRYQEFIAGHYFQNEC